MGDMIDIGGDPARANALLFDRGPERTGQHADRAASGRQFPNSTDHGRRRRLNVRDLRWNVAGGLGGLRLQR